MKKVESSYYNQIPYQKPDEINKYTECVMFDSILIAS